MRVAYISADLGVPVFGHKGCSTHVQEIVRAFRRLGGEVDLYAARVGGEAPSDLHDVRLVPLPPVSSADRSERESLAIDANLDLLSLLSHAPKYDFIYERYSLWSYAAMEWAQAVGIPSVLEVNAPLIEEQQEHRELHHRDAANAIASRTFAAASAIIAVSDEVADYLIRRNVSASKVHVIPNGVDPSRFDQVDVSAESIDGDRFTIGFVGTLKPWHGVSQLVEAFIDFRQHHPEAELLIIGDGPERDSLQAMIAVADGASCKAVRWTGAVPPAQIPALMRDMHIAVAPYPDAAGFYFSPLKVFEYMAAGIATVASDIGQLRKVIDHGYDGLLVKAGSVSELVSAFEHLCHNRSLRQQLGTAARRKVLAKHTWQCVAQQILDIIMPHQRTSVCGSFTAI